MQECCGACHSHPGCVAATFAKGESCWLKNAEDAAGGAYQRGGDIVGCILPKLPPTPPQPTPPPPPPPPTSPAVFKIKANVPGDLLTDLQLAGVIQDPLYELVFKNATVWDSNSWVYTQTFSVSSAALTENSGITSLLVFDGVKMGARVIVNGQQIGEVADQFLRYTFPLNMNLLREGSNANTLELVFDKSVSCGGRWMACTGGWDWVSSLTSEHRSTI